MAVLFEMISLLPTSEVAPGTSDKYDYKLRLCTESPKVMLHTRIITLTDTEKGASSHLQLL